MKYSAAVVSVALSGCFAEPSSAQSSFDEIIYSASGELCTVAPVAGARERCVAAGYEYGSPSWQPNGDVLVVEAVVHDGPAKLVLFDQYSNAIRDVPDSDGFIRPVWGPDGRYFFASDYRLGRAIRRWTADGGGFTTIPVTTTEPFRYVQMISFAPDGRFAALLVDDFRKMLIARVSDSGFAVEKVLPAGFAYVAQAAWLDDTRLLFVGRHDGERGQLWELNVSDGTVEQRGISGLWIRDFLALSPDGSMVVVCGKDDAEASHWNLWKYSLTSSELTRLTSGVEDVTPTWRRD